MEGLFALITIFSYSFGNVISYLTGWNQSFVLRILAVLGIVFSIIEYQISICYGSSKHRIIVFKRMLFLYILILAGMLATIFINGYTASMMKTYLLSFGSKALSGVFLGYALYNKDLLAKIFRWIEPFCVFYTVVLLGAVVNNTGGTMYTYDINRQTLSYAAAYVLSLLLFYIFNFEKIDKYKVFSYQIWKWFNYLLIIIDIFVIFAGGGRGAFVLAATVYLYYLINNFSAFSFKKMFEVILMVCVLVVAIRYLSTTNSASRGFASIITSFENGFTDRSSEERRELWTNAFEYAKSTAFIGGGAGSTAYTIGYYTHNIFMDILAEFGIGGLVLTLYILGNAFKRIFWYCKNYISMEFLMIVFLCALVMLMFSGSWYSEGALWVAVTSILAFDEVDAYEELK